jgi:DNA helicase HerA-like ATPase
MILTGRHRKNAVIVTSQRPAEVAKTLLSQSSHIFAGCFFEKNDMDYLASAVGSEVNRLPSLPIGHFLWFRPGKEAKIIQNR